MVNVINTTYPCRAFAESRIGGRAENQDTCAWTDTPVGLLILVCDGMGGGPGGKTASMIAASVISGHMKTVTKPYRAADELAKAVNMANAAIIMATGRRPEHIPPACDPESLLPPGFVPRNDLKGMGSTVAALLLNDDHAIAAHIGDSRIYQFRGKKVVYRSTDHSHVMELVKSGVLTEEQARVSGESNIITRALGHSAEKLDCDTVVLPYLKGDRFVLCSDGIWGMFPARQLVKMLTATRNPSGTVDSVVITVDNEGQTAGGNHDNLTIAVADTTHNSKDSIPMSKINKILFFVLALTAALSIILNIIQWHYRPSAPEPRTQVKTDTVKVVVRDTVFKGTASPAATPAQAPGTSSDNTSSVNRGIGNAGDMQSQINDLTARLDALIKEVENLKKITNAAQRFEKSKEASRKLEALLPLLASDSNATRDLKKVIRELKNKSQITNSRSYEGQINVTNKILKKVRNSVASRI